MKQKPIAWMNKEANIFAQHEIGAKNFNCTIPLYANPLDIYEKLPIKDEDYEKIAERFKGDVVGYGKELIILAIFYYKNGTEKLLESIRKSIDKKNIK
jgi:hypothetical protein